MNNKNLPEDVERNSVAVETPIRRLQLAFKQSGMTQVQLANATGITKSTISRYLQGEFEPKASALIKLASALNVSVEYLMGMETIEQEDSFADDSGERRNTDSRGVLEIILRLHTDTEFFDLVDKVNKLNDEQRRVLKEFLTVFSR